VGELVNSYSNELINNVKFKLNQKQSWNRTVITNIYSFTSINKNNLT